MRRKPSGGGPYCAASWCNNFYGCRFDKPYSFFTFPKDPERFSQWVKFSLRYDLLGKTPDERRSLRLCSAHFHESQIQKYFRRKLLIRSAIPTIVEEMPCRENISSMSMRRVLDSEDTILGEDMPVPSDSSSSHDDESPGRVLHTNDCVEYEEDSEQNGESSESRKVKNPSQDENLCELSSKSKFDEAVGVEDTHHDLPALFLKVTKPSDSLSDPLHPRYPDPPDLQDHSPAVDTNEDSNEFSKFVDSATLDHDYFGSTVPGKLQVSGYINTQQFCKDGQGDILSKQCTLEKLRRELCRLCGQRGSVLKPLFETTSDTYKDVSVLSKIDMYLPIKVKLEDSLPFCICYNCLSVVNQWHELYTTCVAADAVLLKTFGKESHMTTVSNGCTSKVRQNAETQTEEMPSDALTNKTSTGDLRAGILTVEIPSDSVTHETIENEDICTNCRESKTEILQEDKLFKKEFDKCFRMNLNTSYKCRFCHELFRNSVDRKSHIAVCHQLSTICELCGYKVRCRKDLKKHKYQKHTTAAPRKYLCDKCDRFCTSASGLKFHLKNIHGAEDISRKYCCELCCSLFTREIYYHKHKRKHEMGKVKTVIEMENFRQEVNPEGSENGVTYVCPVCQAMFNDKLSLAVHLTDKKKLKCSSCHNVVNSEKSLFLHVCGQWTCQYCLKSFDQRVKWLVHERWHTGEKPLKCRKCDKMFRTWQSRRYHEYYHDTSLQCTYCERNFRNKYVFEDHVSRHEGKEFPCHICNKKFSAQKYLRRHLTNFHKDLTKDVCSNE